jgi:hypothetical protein
LTAQTGVPSINVVKRLAASLRVVLVAAFVLASIACPCRQAAAAWHALPGQIDHACCDGRASTSATSSHGSPAARHSAAPGCAHCPAALGQTAEAPAVPATIAAPAPVAGAASHPVLAAHRERVERMPELARRGAVAPSLLLVKHSRLI